MTKSFDQIIETLRKKSQPLPVERLPELSDLDPLQVDQLWSIWSEIEPQKRRTLLSELGKLSHLHFEYDFERINRIAIDDEDAEVRRLAIENLWECEDVTLSPKLLEVLQNDPEHPVRAAAATALATFVYLCEVSDLDAGIMRQIEDALLNATSNDQDTNVRLRSIEALGHSSRAEVPLLIQQTYDLGDDDHKKAALMAMGRSANMDWGAVIISEMHNTAPLLRAQAANSAGELELQESVDELIDLLKDVNSDVRIAASWSLGQIGGSRAMQTLTDLLENTDDSDEADLINEALDHAIFIDSTPDFAGTNTE